MINKKIRVLIVDDSPVFTNIIEEILESVDMEVIGVAKDAFEAGDKIIKLKPDVVTLDVEMPKMSGIEFLKLFMPQFPLPFVMVSSVSSSVFDALNAGAVDFIAKPTGLDEQSISFFASELVTKVKIASIAKPGAPIIKNNADQIRLGKVKEGKLIAIGASTGGTEAIMQIIRSFPKQVPPILIVQHMPPVFTNLYAKRLNAMCAMEVQEAKDGDLVCPGRVLIAPGGKQMKLVQRSNQLKVHCYEDEKVNGHAPSVDVLFQSVAKEVGHGSIGVLLTGMGKDGASGLLAMKQKGAYTIAQDEESSIVYGMPKEAAMLGGASKILPLSNIPGDIIRHLKVSE